MDAVASKLAFSAGGYVNPAGLADFIRKYSSPDMLPTFAEFSDNPVTRTVVKALRDLALRPASVSGADGYAVQYGVSVGLGIAAQLLDDPSALFPALFRDTPPPASEPQTPSFATTVDDLVDQIPD